MTAPRPYGNPAADRARAEALKSLLGDEPDHDYRCNCEACVAYRVQENASRK